MIRNLLTVPLWISKFIPISSSVKWDLVLLPTFFIFNIFTFSAWLQLGEVATKPWLLLMWLYGLVSLLPLVWRNKAPLTVFATQWVLTVAAWPILSHYTPIVGIPISVYAVAVNRSKKISLLALLASFVPNAITAAVAFTVYHSIRAEISSFIDNAAFVFILTVGAWALGRLATERHAQHILREREAAREAIAAERRRIARELHDIVSHAVTVMVLQAAGAARIAKTDFAQVAQSLTHIEAQGKQAMVELHRLLGVLRAGDPADRISGIGQLGPQPGLADVATLLASLRATGMSIAVQTEGAPCELDPSVDLTAYRIVQEGLTNALKHGGNDANHCLHLIWGTRSLKIQVDNDVNSAQAHHGQALSAGRGLVGLRERAQAVGGHLHAGPHQDGYRLIASLPLAEAGPRVSVGHTQTLSPH